MIEAKDVTYSYPDRSTPALVGASIEIERAELSLVAGLSGSGKSTLLRTCNGLIPHFHGGSFAGRVHVDTIDTLSTRPRELARIVGFVGQFPEASGVADVVEEDVAFALENLGSPPNEMRKRVEEALDALGIASLRARRLETLSSGERQRVSIAGAIAASPHYLIMDEPTSQLDPQSAEEVIAALLRLRDDIGIGLVVSEHRLDRILQYTDKMYLCDAGRVSSGTVSELIAGTTIGPPVAELGRQMGWIPTPLTLREARSRAAGLAIAPRSDRPSTFKGMPLAGLEGVWAGMGSSQALRDVTLTVCEGEVVALMGRNGSGKTTALRCLAGLLKPQRGQASVNLSTAFLPQDPSRVLFRKSVSDEIAATLSGRGIPVSPQALSAEAERFGVSKVLGKFPRDLSGGEQTLAAMAATCAGSPRVLLLDEPTRGIDNLTRAAIQELIGRYREQGHGIVLVTHDVELAASTATRVVLLGDGEVISDGSPSEVLSGSITFSTQMNKVFGRSDLLTVKDVLAHIA